LNHIWRYFSDFGFKRSEQSLESFTQLSSSCWRGDTGLYGVTHTLGRCGEN